MLHWGSYQATVAAPSKRSDLPVKGGNGPDSGAVADGNGGGRLDLLAENACPPRGGFCNATMEQSGRVGQRKWNLADGGAVVLRINIVRFSARRSGIPTAF